MIRVMLYASVVLVGFTAFARAQALNEYTLELPADLPSDATLCQSNVVIAGTAAYAATMLHNSSDPLPDGGALATQHGDFEYRSWVATRDGIRTLVIQTTARNVFSVEAGFCRAPADPNAAVADFFPVNSPLVGGSPTEEDRRGRYDGIAEIIVEICGYDDPFPLVERIQSALDTAVVSNLNAHIVFGSFDTSSDGTRAFIEYQLAGHGDSLQLLAEAAQGTLADIGEFSFVPGDRKLQLGNCDRRGLWITVSDGNKILWQEEFDGPRMIATRQEAGNIFMTYAAGVATIFLNIAGAENTGEYPIGPPPPPDSSIDPQAVTYGMFHYRGRMPSPIIATSVSGTYWLTALESAAGVSGYFRFTAEEEGQSREVWGGFRNLKLHN